MRISFFEEYPSPDNLEKLKIIPFDTSLYVAAKSLRDFLVLKSKIREEYKNVDKIIYWPILDLSEGYWLSALSGTQVLERLIKEIKFTKEYILWDAEMPWLNKKLYFKNLPFVYKNKQLISRMLFNKADAKRLTVTAFPKAGMAKLISSFLFVSFSHGDFVYIDMLYSSMLTVTNKEKYLEKIIKTSKNNFTEYKVALGLIGRGDEDIVTPLISPGDLERDLLIVQNEGVKDVVVYRLGGLNGQYVSVLKQFCE